MAIRLKADSFILKAFLFIVIFFAIVLFGTFHIINESQEDSSASKYFYDKFSSVNLASNFKLNNISKENLNTQKVMNSLSSLLSKSQEFIPKSHNLTCPYGEEVTFWKETSPKDFHFQLPFSQTNQEKELFLSFEPDHGGWNNIRMHMEIVIVLAYVTGRTLVLPPSQPLYLLNSGDKEENMMGLADFFPLEELKKKIKTITMEDYLIRFGLSGKLHKQNTGIFPEHTFVGDTQESMFPPKDKVSFNFNIRDERLALWDYIRNVSYCPHWEPFKTFMIIPKEKSSMSEFYPQTVFNPPPLAESEYNGGDKNGIGPYTFEYFISPSSKHLRSANNEIDNLSDEEKQKLVGRGRYHRYHSPFSSDMTFKERQMSRIEKFAANRTAIYYDKKLQNEQFIHIITRFEVNYRLFNHFYAFLFFENPEVDQHIKRFVRDNLHYSDNILCVAAKVVALVLRDVKELTSNQLYTAFHIRRGEFQYKVVKLSSEQLLENLKDDLPEDHEFVYIASDERDKSFFNEFKEKYKYVKFLDDYFEEAGLADVNPNLYGMIDQLICVKAHFFVGSWFSTFTGYITRMRGYYGYPENTVRFGDLDHKDRYLKYEYPKFPFYMREFPDAWAAIDDELI